jgi:hypothetical protein
LNSNAHAITDHPPLTGGHRKGKQPSPKGISSVADLADNTVNHIRASEGYTRSGAPAIGRRRLQGRCPWTYYFTRTLDRLLRQDEMAALQYILKSRV